MSPERKYTVVLDAMILSLETRRADIHGKWEMATEQNLPTVKTLSALSDRLSAQIDILTALKRRMEGTEEEK